MPGLIERGGIGGEESHFRNLWEEKWRELKMGQGEVLKELEGKCFAASQKFGKIKVPDLMDISVTMVAVDVFAEHWFVYLGVALFFIYFFMISPFFPFSCINTYNYQVLLVV